MLHLLIFVPLLAALGILFGAKPRKTAIIAGTAQGILSLYTFFGYDRAQGGFQYLSQIPIVPEWKLSYLLAADGLSVVMLLLTGLVTLAAVWFSSHVERRQRLYYACILFISAGCAGAFAAQDLFFFYAYHELALIPTFLLIGLFGSGERYVAAWKITIYLALGSFVLLIGLVDLLQSLPVEYRTLNMIDLQSFAMRQPIPPDAQGRPFLFLLIGFGTLVSLFPFHSWAPSAYASAPTPAAMLHAGVLKKFGLYGLLRLAVPLLPAGLQDYTWLLIWLLLANIIYIGLVTIAQKKLDLMLGYSSVMHMGYIFLGIASLNIIGVSGAALLMFAHGLSIAALFALAGAIRERNLTLSFESLGGLARVMPTAGLLFGFAAFASIGLPGFANFASEIMVFFGAFRQGATNLQFSALQVATVFALWGVVISAVYMLRAYRRVFMGEPGEAVAKWSDLAQPQRWPVILLVAFLLLAGFVPGYFLSYLTPPLQAVLR